MNIFEYFKKKGIDTIDSSFYSKIAMWDSWYRANVKGLYSPKTGKTYDGTIVLTDTGGKYVNYKIEIPKKK